MDKKKKDKSKIKKTPNKISQAKLGLDFAIRWHKKIKAGINPFPSYRRDPYAQIDES